MDDIVQPAAEAKLFTHTIRVRWGDCDPARIAYTGRIPYFALEAIEEWWRVRVGMDWFHGNVDRNVGTPFVHMSIDFRSPVTPRHPLVCEVRLIRLGESSVRFSVRGFQNEMLCFEGEFVEVFVDGEAHRKIPAPEDIRRRLEALLVD
jgi:acyl-CoA thioesterase FadM